MFFDARQRQLALRCQALQLRSATLREALARDSQGLQPALALADRLHASGRWLLAHPQWVGAGVALLVVWRPRRAWRLGLRAWSAWRLWRRLRRWQAALPGPLAAWR